MQHVIIFDGPDGCGKTNMAREVSSRLDVPYFKNQREFMFFEDDPGYFVRAMKYGDPYFCDYLRQTKASIILDRSYPSEWVYSQAFGRPTEMWAIRMVDELYADLRAKLIIPFRSDYSHVEDRFEAITKEKLETLHELYAQFCQWTKCDVIRFCVDDEDLQKQMEMIIPFVTDPPFLEDLLDLHGF